MREETGLRWNIPHESSRRPRRRSVRSSQTARAPAVRLRFPKQRPKLRRQAPLRPVFRPNSNGLQHGRQTGVRLQGLPVHQGNFVTTLSSRAHPDRRAFFAPSLSDRQTPDRAGRRAGPLIPALVCATGGGLGPVLRRRSRGASEVSAAFHPLGVG